MEIIFATGNKGKLREAAEILGEGYTLRCNSEVGITEDVEETGETLKENSLQKAMYIYNKTGKNCFADDTGLEVDALDGAPGVYTARYAGEDCNFDDNMNKLLVELEKVGAMAPEQRTCRFRSVVTLIIDGEPHFFDGTLEGRIALEKSGHEGFGYDPVFIPNEYPQQTLAELGVEIKNAISHRGQALRAMAQWLKK